MDTNMDTMRGNGMPSGRIETLENDRLRKSYLTILEQKEFPMKKKDIHLYNLCGVATFFCIL